MISPRLLKECFWEFGFSPQDIEDLFESRSWEDQQFLFEKILANSTELLVDMELFDMPRLEQLIMAYAVPTFNHSFLLRRKQILEYYFLGSPMQIEELKWPA